jgi:hypothetical protein
MGWIYLREILLNRHRDRVSGLIGKSARPPRLAASFISSEGMSAIGTKRTSLVAPRMSANDAKRTFAKIGLRLRLDLRDSRQL